MNRLSGKSFCTQKLLPEKLGKIEVLKYTDLDGRISKKWVIKINFEGPFRSKFILRRPIGVQNLFCVGQ